MAKKYYACRTVGNEGIYFGDWANCAPIVQSSGKQDYKGFSSKESALDYMHLYHTGLSASELLNSALQPQDLPLSIQHELLNLIGVHSLNEINTNYRQFLRNAFDYNQNQAVDYHGKTKEYALMYLPVNMYKIWIPMRLLLEKRCLPVKHAVGSSEVPLKILELGAGPGTSTFGLLSFYKAIAEDNPHLQININYNIVEREMDFETVFEALKAAFLKNLPQNLHVTIHKTVQRDAENHMLFCAGMGYDLITESNMINSNEHHDAEYRNRMIPDIVAALRPGGFAILIEPGTQSNINMLNELVSYQPESVWAPPLKASISMEKNALFLEQRNLLIRSKYTDFRHWLSYCILTHPFKELAL